MSRKGSASLQHRWCLFHSTGPLDTQTNPAQPRSQQSRRQSTSHLAHSTPLTARTCPVSRKWSASLSSAGESTLPCRRGREGRRLSITHSARSTLPMTRTRPVSRKGSASLQHRRYALHSTGPAESRRVGLIQHRHGASRLSSGRTGSSQQPTRIQQHRRENHFTEPTDTLTDSNCQIVIRAGRSQQLTRRVVPGQRAVDVTRRNLRCAGGMRIRANPPLAEWPMIQLQSAKLH